MIHNFDVNEFIKKTVIQNIFILFIFVYGLSLTLNIKFRIGLYVLFARYRNKHFKNKFIFTKIVKTMFHQTLSGMKENNISNGFFHFLICCCFKNFKNQ